MITELSAQEEAPEERQRGVRFRRIGIGRKGQEEWAGSKWA